MPLPPHARFYHVKLLIAPSVVHCCLLHRYRLSRPFAKVTVNFSVSVTLQLYLWSYTRDAILLSYFGSVSVPIFKKSDWFFGDNRRQSSLVSVLSKLSAGATPRRSIGAKKENCSRSTVKRRYISIVLKTDENKTSDCLFSFVIYKIFRPP